MLYCLCLQSPDSPHSCTKNKLSGAQQCCLGLTGSGFVWDWTGLFGKLSCRSLKSIFVVSLSWQWPVCYSEEVSREKHRAGVCCQVHQEAPEPGQPARGEPGGDRARGQHPAAGPARQHRQAARRL